MTLKELLDTVDNSDLYEEEAEDFLLSHKIPLVSHSRLYIYKLAWRNGWRPKK